MVGIFVKQNKAGHKPREIIKIEYLQVGRRRRRESKSETSWSLVTSSDNGEEAVSYPRYEKYTCKNMDFNLEILRP